jgi:hypothetical protein
VVWTGKELHQSSAEEGSGNGIEGERRRDRMSNKLDSESDEAKKAFQAGNAAKQSADHIAAVTHYSTGLETATSIELRSGENQTCIHAYMRPATRSANSWKFAKSVVWTMRQM